MRRVYPVVIGTAALGALAGWLAHHVTSPALTVEAVVAERVETVVPAEPLEEFPLVGEEDDELEDLLVEGERLPAPGRDRRGPRIRPLADAWAEYAPAAERGDARAAMRLFMALDMCRRFIAPTPREARQRERMQQAIGGAPAEWRERAQRDFAAMEAGCEGADPAWLETGLDWLTQAADGGQVAAKLMWASRAGAYLDLESADDETRRWHAQMAARYLNEAVTSGSTQAMMMVARRDAEADPVNALAHAALAYRVMDERARAAALARGPADPPRRARFQMQQQQRMQSMMFEASGRLTNMQIASAHRRADELYDRCCR